MRKFLPILFMTITIIVAGCNPTDVIEDKKESPKFTVTFDSNGGSAVTSQEVVEGGLALRPLPPVKEGSTFNDWYGDQELTTVYDFGTFVTAHITLYAKWTTVDRSTLEELVKTCEQLVRKDYTGGSYSAMGNKLSAAISVLNDSSATKEQIEKAYNELNAAVKALIKIPYRPTKLIFIDSRVMNGIIYITPGSEITIYAVGEDGNGNSSTNSKVIFSYEGLEAWVDGNIQTTDHSIRFNAKPSLNEGDELNLTITSAELPEISKTVILKVFDTKDVKVRFIDTVNSLPEPDKISYDDRETLDMAYFLSRFLPYEVPEDPALEAVRRKLEDCDMAYDNLPIRFFYSFEGDVCTFIFKDYPQDYEENKLNYIAEGEFPAGMYASTKWEYDEMDYYQTKFVLKADKTLVLYEREADDHTGKNATPWELVITGTYTYTGDKSNGGIFYVTYNYEMAPKQHRILRNTGK